jgi:hypothetical protein
MIDETRRDSARARILLDLQDAEYHDSMAMAARARMKILTRTWELCRHSELSGLCCGNPLDCQGKAHE